MQLLELFKTLTIHPKNAAELKGLILQLAIQGKLTQKWRASHPELVSGPHSATALLEKIKAEKAQLVKEGKLKKEKPLAKIEEGEIPFKLPQTWTWSRLGNALTYGTYEKLESSDASNDIWVLELEDIEKETSRLLQRVRFQDRNFKSTKNKFKAGDIIYGKLRPYLDKVIVADEDGVCTTEMIPIKPHASCSSEYIRWYLKSKFFIAYADNSTHGMNLPRLGTEKALLAPFVLPPLEEQKAIVSIVNQLFQEVDALESQTRERVRLQDDFVASALQQLTTGDVASEWAFLQPHFKSFFTSKQSVKKLRESILQLAVQGKLTSHWRIGNPNIEPASVLLEKIKAEKAQLIKAGKIKKEKPLPAINEDEIPYKLTNGWVWCRFQEIFDIRDGTHDSPKDAFGPKTYPLVTSKNFNTDQIDFDSARRISEEDYLKVIQRSQVHKGDILFSMIGGNIGNQVEVGEFTEYAIKNVALFKHYKLGLPAEGFLRLFSKYLSMNLQTEAAGGAQPFVSLKYFRNLVVAVPPHAEQKAIVEKVNSLMALCDQLEQEIERNTQQVEALMQSCLKEVLAGKKEAIHV